MKTLVFIRHFYKDYPLINCLNTFVIIAVGFFNIIAVISIAPVIDIFLNNELDQTGHIGQHVLSFLKYLRIPISAGSIVAVFLIINIVAAVLTILAKHLILREKYAINKDLLINTFKDFFSARWLFFCSTSQGNMLNTFERELNVVGNALGAIGLLFANVTQVLMYLIVPFAISTEVTVIAILMSFLLVLPFIALGRKSYKLGMMNTETSNE